MAGTVSGKFAPSILIWLTHKLWVHIFLEPFQPWFFTFFIIFLTILWFEKLVLIFVQWIVRISLRQIPELSFHPRYQGNKRSHGSRTFSLTGEFINNLIHDNVAMLHLKFRKIPILESCFIRFFVRKMAAKGGLWKKLRIWNL